MKTQRTFALLLVVFAILAGTAVYGQFNAGRYSNSDSGSIVPKPPRTASTDATYGVGPYPKFRPVLTPGDGRQEVNAYCDTCHSPNFITMQPPLPADTWAAEVTKMVKTYGAQIPDDATQKIIRYLQSNYTPETRKH